jgi:hypothetical protein
MKLLAALVILFILPYLLIGAIIGLIVAILYAVILLDSGKHLGIRKRLSLSLGIPAWFFFLLFAWGWLAFEAFRPQAQPSWAHHQTGR